MQVPEDPGPADARNQCLWPCSRPQAHCPKTAHRDNGDTGGGIQNTAAFGQPAAHCSTSPPRLASLIATAQELLHSSLAPSTQTAYTRSWERFNVFASTMGFSTSLPSQPNTVALFIADLVQKGFKPATGLHTSLPLASSTRSRGIPDLQMQRTSACGPVQDHKQTVPRQLTGSTETDSVCQGATAQTPSLQGALGKEPSHIWLGARKRQDMHGEAPRSD